MAVVAASIDSIAYIRAHLISIHNQELEKNEKYCVRRPGQAQFGALWRRRRKTEDKVDDVLSMDSLRHLFVAF